MLFYVVIKPDKTPLETPFLTMQQAQEAIDAVEPDLLERGKYAIHPISQLSDLRVLNVTPNEKVTLEKFDGEYVGQAPVEVINL